MKIRIRGNSIRFRLTQSELEIFEKEGAFEQVCNFGPKSPQHLTYSLKKDDDLRFPDAVMQDGKITVKIPKEQASSWANSDQVGIEYVQQEHQNQSLIILVEKDFQCMKQRPEEDESDNFPNPQALV